MFVVVVLALVGLLYSGFLWTTSASKARTFGIAGFVVGAIVGGGFGIAGGGSAVSGIFVLPFVFFIVGCLIGRQKAA